METKVEDMDDYDALLAKLWKQPEGSRVDFKAAFVFGKDAKKEMYGLVKDILAMGNTEGGGYLIIGRKNSREADDCSLEVVQSFDPTKVHAQTRKYGRPEPKYIVSKATSPEGTTAILICVDEFEEHLIICQENADDDEKRPILRAGAIYIRSRTENATSALVVSEQDMRSLIRRSMLKSGQHFRKILEEAVGGYFDGVGQNKSFKESNVQWEREEALLSKEIESQLSLDDHLLQIVAYPLDFNSRSLKNCKVLKERLMDSVQQYYGWSFPCPDFELRDVEVAPDDSNYIAADSSRLFGEGELRYAFAVSLSGLIIYREQITTAYDKATPGKPLLLSPLFMTIFRAIGFLGRFFSFVSARDQICVKILATDTHRRIPATQISTMYNYVTPFHESNELPHPEVGIELEISRDELSNKQVSAFFKIIRKFVDRMDIPVTDEQLFSEIEKIAKPQ